MPWPAPVFAESGRCCPALECDPHSREPAGLTRSLRSTRGPLISVNDVALLDLGQHQRVQLDQHLSGAVKQVKKRIGRYRDPHPGELLGIALDRHGIQALGGNQAGC